MSSPAAPDSYSTQWLTRSQRGGRILEYVTRAEVLKKGLEEQKNPPKKGAKGAAGGAAKDEEEEEEDDEEEEAPPLTEEQLKKAEEEMEEDLAKLVGMESVKVNLGRPHPRHSPAILAVLSPRTPGTSWPPRLASPTPTPTSSPPQPPPHKAARSAQRRQVNMRKLCKQLSLDIKRRQEKMSTLDSIRHMMFTGNPGVGKTTVSRLVARLYKQLGVSSKETVVEVQKGDLVAGYVNQTSIKTAKKIKEARGGILFVDEAYQLTQALQRGQARLPYAPPLIAVAVPGSSPLAHTGSSSNSHAR